MLNTDKELKLYYSIAEVADMFGVNASLLRFWVTLMKTTALLFINANALLPPS